MQLGETIATYDVALALRGESGKFEVKSPGGEIFHVTCKPNLSISSFEWSGSKAEVQPFLVRKVAEPVSLQAGVTSTSLIEGESQTRSGQPPFLLERQESETKLSSNSDRVVSLPKIIEDNSGNLEPANLDLLFLESDPKSGQPSACVCVKIGQLVQTGKNERLITSTCATLNEFDAEIRRLHGQLDELRARARKLFYKSQVAVASA
jgi:hypothetical protein